MTEQIKVYYFIQITVHINFFICYTLESILVKLFPLQRFPTVQVVLSWWIGLVSNVKLMQRRELLP